MKIEKAYRAVSEDFVPMVKFEGEFDLHQWQDMNAKAIVDGDDAYRIFGKKLYDEIMDLIKVDQ